MRPSVNRFARLGGSPRSADPLGPPGPPTRLGTRILGSRLAARRRVCSTCTGHRLTTGVKWYRAASETFQPARFMPLLLSPVTRAVYQAEAMDRGVSPLGSRVFGAKDARLSPALDSTHDSPNTTPRSRSASHTLTDPSVQHSRQAADQWHRQHQRARGHQRGGKQQE